MVFYKVAFGVCLVLLSVCYAALASARKKGDPRQIRVLHFLRIGLSLSAISYSLRFIYPPPPGHTSPAVILTCLTGTVFIWLGWIGHGLMRWERQRPPVARRPGEVCDEAGEEVSAAGTPPLATSRAGRPLNSRVHRVLSHAQDEARRRGQGCVDAEHLLLGLLREPHSAGVCILERLDVKAEKVHLELLGQIGPRRGPMGKAPTDTAALTERADQVLALAAQEAHRFDKALVGTEHLLLGLALAGKGKTAAVLFGEGVTVDGIRSEIIKMKKAA